MNRSKIILLLIISVTCILGFYLFFTKRSVAKCPQNIKGTILLPRNYPIKELYVGHIQNDAPDYQDFVKYLNEISNVQNIKFMMPQNKSIWPRDAFKLGFNIETHQKVTIELPYKNENAGDYGGNIMPITEKLIIVGNNMSFEVRKTLEQKLNQEFVEIDTAWLRPGHVDEIITTIPMGNAPCGITIGYASPLLALKLLSHDLDNHDTNKLGSVIYLTPDDDGTDFNDCFAHIQNNNKNMPKHCQEYIKANETYQKMITTDVKKIVDKMKELNHCEDVKTIAIPQLFSPQNMTWSYGDKKDHARASHPNMVNNILLDEILILPNPNYFAFQNYMQNYLNKIKQKHIFIKSDTLHELSGAFHCATNEFRYCE